MAKIYKFRFANSWFDSPMATWRTLTGTLNVSNLWCPFLAVVDEIACHVSDLRLATARVARRHHNLHLAERLLIDEVCSNVNAPEDGATSVTSARAALTRVYATNSVVERTKLLRIEREVSKLMHARGQHRDAIETLSTSVVNEARLVVESQTSKVAAGVCRQLNTRSLLLLVQWLQLDHKNLATLASQVKVVAGDYAVEVTEVARNLKLLLDMERSGALASKGLVPCDSSDSDEGTFLKRPLVVVSKVFKVKTWCSVIFNHRKRGVWTWENDDGISILPHTVPLLLFHRAGGTTIRSIYCFEMYRQLDHHQYAHLLCVFITLWTYETTPKWPYLWNTNYTILFSDVAAQISLQSWCLSAATLLAAAVVPNVSVIIRYNTENLK